EKPARVSRTVERLKDQTELPISWVEPLAVDDAIIERAHSKGHIARVTAAVSDFDGDTPGYPDIFGHARRSVGGALQAMRSALKGELAFSLLRPPGHHATREHAMGFCYLNSIAIAALEAMASGIKKVAVFDFDVHHGNGTEAILLNRSGAAFFSIHQYPCYPGTGTSNVGDNCFNYPVAPETPGAAPNSKDQAPKNFQLPSAKPRSSSGGEILVTSRRWVLRFGSSLGFGTWSLELNPSMFRPQQDCLFVGAFDFDAVRLHTRV